MNLEETKESLKKEIDEYSAILELKKMLYEKLKGCKQPSTSELYNGIENYFSIKKKTGTYEHILGGDGRSRPWSEKREGLIVNVKIKEGIYLDSKQVKIVKEYVNSIHKPDNIVLSE